MPIIASSFDSEWLDVLDRLPSDLDLEQLARETKALLRCRKITAASDLGPGGRCTAAARISASCRFA